jgi:hypothetical protein
MTAPEIQCLLDRTGEMVSRLQEAAVECSRIAALNTLAIQEAREIAEHARFTANAASAELSGMVVAQQRLEKTINTICERMDRFEAAKGIA